MLGSRSVLLSAMQNQLRRREPRSLNRYRPVVEETLNLKEIELR